VAISIVPGSILVTVATRPGVNTPAVDGAFMTFTCSSGIRLTGECKITGSAGDNPAGWTLGIIQLKFVDTDWACYRGQSNGDGSSFLQYSRPPALPKGGCRDTLAVGGIFIDNNPGLDRTVATAGAVLPLKMSALLTDAPGRGFDLSRRNGLTTKTNYLREAQTELHFCTVLSLMSPGGVYQHLKSVYWNVHWQGRFLPSNFANLAAPWTINTTGGPLGNMANVSKIIDGRPTDGRFASIVTAAATPNCNAATNASYAAPNVRESTTIWANFDVTQ
jgi:hypothetical protein